MMTARFGLVIFDCDGVLVDTERIAVAVDVQVINVMGWAITTEEVIERFVGRSHEYMTAAIAEQLGRPLAPDWDDDYGHLYRAAFEAGVPAVDGIEIALDRITLPTCVASSGSHEKMRFTLGRAGLYPRFEGRIFSGSEVVRAKPAPDLFLHAATQMGFAPATCAVIEDSPFGVEAALAAGMQPFAYTGGVVSRAKLERDGVTTFDDMRELPDLLSWAATP